MPQVTCDAIESNSSVTFAIHTLLHLTTMTSRECERERALIKIFRLRKKWEVSEQISKNKKFKRNA